MNTNHDKLDNIFEIGPIVAEGIVRFWIDGDNKNVVLSCINNGLAIAKPKLSTRAQILKSKTFVLTGSLETLARSKAKEFIEKLGGRVRGSVSSKTDYLIAGPGSGIKLKKAHELGIKVLSEKEFLTMIDEINEK